MAETSEHTVSVRDARAHLTQILDRAAQGGATVITRGGTPVAAVVSMGDYNALEDAIDGHLARQAERLAATGDGQPRYTMSEIVADIFDEQPGTQRNPVKQGFLPGEQPPE